MEARTDEPKTVWIVFGLVLAVFVGLCGAALALSRTARTGPDTTQGNAIIDWVDFVRWNGQSYDRLHNGALTSPDRVGKPLGTVRFRLEGHVGNPHYAPKDGDAAFLDEGTPLYEVNGYADGSVMAAAVPYAPHGYRLYAVRQSHPELFKGLEPANSDKPIKQVQVMTESAGSVIPLRTFTSAGAQQFLDMLKRSGEPQPAPSLDESWSRYGFVLDTGEAIGYYAELYRKGDQIYWTSGGFRRMPVEALLYVNQTRETVFTVGGIEFPLPGQSRLASGETIVANGDAAIFRSGRRTAKANGCFSQRTLSRI